MLTLRNRSSPLAPHHPHCGMWVRVDPQGVFGTGQPKTGERASAERIKASVVISLMRLIFFFSSFLAGSKSWNCCQTSGAGLHPKRRLGAGTSHGEWVHDEEPFTEAANYETTADAGTMPRASAGSCAVHLTGRDRTDWNGETNSQQTLRSDPGAAGLSQSRAVLPERGHDQVLLSRSECSSAHSCAREEFSHLRIIAVSRGQPQSWEGRR